MYISLSFLLSILCHLKIKGENIDKKISFLFWSQMPAALHIYETSKRPYTNMALTSSSNFT